MIKKLLLIVMLALTSFAYEIVINETIKLEKKHTLTRDDSSNIITDSTTGMMWKDDYKVKKTWNEAKGYCQDLKMGGYDDWRLPAINELESIADYRQYKPAIKAGFDNITSHIYWSSSTDISNSNDAWFLLFENGRSYTLDKTNIYNVKCVRVEKKKPLELKKKGDVVTDNGTGIVWQDSSEVASLQKDYSGARKYCEELALDGKDDWYLPSAEQLLTITDKEKFNPSIKKGFKNTASEGYWSSSIHATHQERVWYVHFGYGFSSDYGSKESNHYVRCARAGHHNGLSFNSLVSKLVEKEMHTIPKPSTRKHLEDRVLKQALEITWGKPILTKFKYNKRKGYFSASLSFEGKLDFEQDVSIKISKKEHINFKRNFKNLTPEAIFEYDGSSVKLKDIRVVHKEKPYSIKLIDKNIEDIKEAVSIGNDIKFDKK
ncbi:DUF1566 domain-containing protein [Candidatus Sulfurimonas marisnigri]|uniref:DUF1566 domain-containing protein n=1 Tax=Candidatus Sulfurimonas marisnigri TaxID=2740405 RepID=A0A7S7LZJ4_9BACT|nr:DUF1566 domain-containing protein [Candidatus Sulfurimonas marisnigri]QOY54155.1 DUF1566 domain-containing protein [Candidatus Sulfurimonas marisnigri]